MFYPRIFCFTSLLISLFISHARGVFTQQGLSTMASIASARSGGPPGTGDAGFGAAWGSDLYPLTVSRGQYLEPDVFQRCAGSLDYLVRDEKGEIVSASQITVTIL